MVTITEELQERGIKPFFFNNLYTRMGDQVPPSQAIPPDQYKAIIAYLIEQRMVDEEGRVDHAQTLNFTIRQMGELATEHLNDRTGYFRNFGDPFREDHLI